MKYHQNENNENGNGLIEKAVYHQWHRGIINVKMLAAIDG
jgi:hypothetical protein